MSYADEMKNLVEDIKTSTRDRIKFVKDNKKDTQDLLARFAQELKDMAQDLRQFLNKSEKDRKENFAKMIKDIQARVKDIFGDTKKLLTGFAGESKERAKDIKDFLAKSEQTRMTDFKAMMKDVQSRVKDVKKHVADLLGEYAKERKEAHSHWEVLRRKERAVAEEKAEEAAKEEKAEEKPRKRGRKAKK